MSSKKKQEKEQKVLKPKPSEQTCSLKESIANLTTIITTEKAKGTPEGNWAAEQASRTKRAFEKMLEKK